MKVILVAIRLSLDLIAGKKLILYCDNEAVGHRLRKSLIKGPAMAPLRDIVMLTVTYDIVLYIVWIASKDNALADDLSRFRFEKVANTYPQLAHLAAKGTT